MSKSKSPSSVPPRILMVDVGGTNAKCMATNQEGLVKIPTGPNFTPQKLMRELLKETKDWRYDAVTIGYPGVVVDGKPDKEPGNLGSGWLKFRFRDAFKKPVRIINDAAMQALAAYESGRMLFVGFGTSVGGAIIVDDVVIPLEIGMLHLSSGRRLLERLKDKHLKEHGRRKWRRSVDDAIETLRAVFHPDDIVLGGGNVKHIGPLPKGCRESDNQKAFRGAARLWPGADMLAESHGTSLRIHRRTPKRRTRSS
jgi:polyphosphate glucokinase